MEGSGFPLIVAQSRLSHRRWPVSRGAQAAELPLRTISRILLQLPVEEVDFELHQSFLNDY